MNRGGGENAARGAGNAAAVEKHLTENREVVSGGEKSRVTCNAADGTRARVVRNAAKNVAKAGAGLRSGRQINFFSRGNVGNPRCGRKKTRVLHAERAIKILRGIFVEALASDALDQFAEQNEIRVAVNEAVAGRIHQCLVIDFLHERVFAGERSGKRWIGRESGSVSEQHANRDLVFAVRGELRHVVRKRIVEANFALLEETHDGGRCGEKFGE